MNTDRHGYGSLLIPLPVFIRVHLYPSVVPNVFGVVDAKEANAPVAI